MFKNLIIFIRAFIVLETPLACNHDKCFIIFVVENLLSLLIIIFAKSSVIFSVKFAKCDALHNLVPFVQFKKREKYPWRSDTFNKVVC